MNISLLRAAIENIWSEFTSVAFADLSCISCTFARENSNIFLPTDPIVLLGTTSVLTDRPDVKADAVSLVGRTTNGQPAKEFFYGLDTSALDAVASNNFRVDPGENANIDAAIAAANSFFAGLVMCGSDGQGISWYPYANQKPNDYWVKRVRQGA